MEEALAFKAEVARELVLNNSLRSYYVEIHLDSVMSSCLYCTFRHGRCLMTGREYVVYILPDSVDLVIYPNGHIPLDDLRKILSLPNERTSGGILEHSCEDLQAKGESTFSPMWRNSVLCCPE
jgi:hypothetical protein